MKFDKNVLKKKVLDFITSQSGRNTLVIAIAAVAVIILASLLLSSRSEYKSAENEYSDLQQYVVLADEDENEQADIEDVPGDDPENSPENYEYNFSRASVDFKQLSELNSDIVGWIQAEAINISYPIVKSDNEYYLTHTFNKSSNRSGCIFMETANTADFSDKNTIIYGHNMKDGSMFGILSQFREQETFEKSPYIWIYTPEGNHLYIVFSCYVSDAVGNAYQIFYQADEEYGQYLEAASKASEIQTNVSVTKEDSIITLSTCVSSDDYRLVVQAKKVY